jgi:iron complex outermembrane recepter protein
MANCRSVRRAVRLALATATAAAGVTALHAQEKVAEAAPEASPPVEEVVVTGSRLQIPNDASISPISTVTATSIEQTGLSRVEDVLNNLPMVFAGENSTSSNGGDGTATVDLRGLGPQRTLVLVNGRRLGPGTGLDGRNYSDINEIPVALIDRVDVLTGGASSVYGADAVAGVVNFVLNTHYEGVKIDAGYNFHQHHQHSPYASLVSEAGDPLPDSSVNTGFGKDVAITMGANFDDNRGNATVYGTYNTLAQVLQSKYDYSACTLKPTSNNKSLVCGGSSIAAGGHFSAYNNSGTSLFSETVDPKTGQFRPFTAADQYNYGPLNFYQTPEERWTAGGFLNYEINSNVTAYAEVMATRTTSTTQVAPSGNFGERGALFIPCADPLLNAAEQAVICSPANQASQSNPTQVINGTTFNGLNVYPVRRNVEGGGRTQSFTADAVRTLVGAKGGFGDAWTYDAYAQHSTVDGSFTQGGYLSNDLIINALTVIPNPATGGVPGTAVGAPVCASAVTKQDTKCVPWNIWAAGGVTPAALKYLTIPLLANYNVTEYVADASITGDMAKYGIKSPLAEDGLRFNVGTEYRQESAAFNPDLEEQLGNAAGSGGPTPPISGGFHVWEGFTEARMPLIEHAPFAESVALEGGYRYSSYNLGFKTNTYKFGVNWQPVQDVMIRGGYNRAVRAPNIGELYSPQAIANDFTVDPCSGATPSFTPAQCARSGVTAAQYGHINANPSNQYNGINGGNPQLQPEKADTYSIGFVFKPSFVPDLNLSADYYDIKVNGDIGVIGGNVILQQCVSQNLFCDLIHRNATGSLWNSQSGYVVDTNVNVGSTTSKGIDVKASYKVPLPPAFGGLRAQLEGTKVIGLYTQVLTGGPNYNCEGFEGGTCGAGQPGWRHVLNTTWTSPWAAWDLTLRWRYVGSVNSDTTSPNPILNQGNTPPPNPHIAAYNYIDLESSYSLSKMLKLTLGVNNIADKDPPVIVGADCPATSSAPGAACNGNTYPGTYDALGRYLFVHVTAQF